MPAAQGDALKAPLWDVAALGAAAYPSNAAYVQQYVTNLLTTSFPNLRPQQVQASGAAGVGAQARWPCWPGVCWQLAVCQGLLLPGNCIACSYLHKTHHAPLSCIRPSMPLHSPSEHCYRPALR